MNCLFKYKNLFDTNLQHFPSLESAEINFGVWGFALAGFKTRDHIPKALLVFQICTYSSKFVQSAVDLYIVIQVTHN